jgi:hypothetical protein
VKRNLEDLWDTIKQTNTWNPKEEEREKRAENLFEEIMSYKLPNLGKEMDIQI